MKGVDISLAGGWIEVAYIVHPAGEVVISMRPVSVFAKGPGCEIEQLRGDLRGRWREATRAVMVLLSLRGLAAAQIAVLLDCHPATVRRWIGRFNDEGMAGLADRARCGRPRLGGGQLTRRIAALLARPGLWTLPRIRRYLGQPQISMRTLYRWVRLVAIWRRPRLTARGDPARDHVVAGIVARLLELPRRSGCSPKTRPTCTCCPMCGPAGRLPKAATDDSYARMPLPSWHHVPLRAGTERAGERHLRNP